MASSALSMPAWLSQTWPVAERRNPCWLAYSPIAFRQPGGTGCTLPRPKQPWVQGRRCPWRGRLVRVFGVARLSCVGLLVGGREPPRGSGCGIHPLRTCHLHLHASQADVSLLRAPLGSLPGPSCRNSRFFGCPRSHDRRLVSQSNLPSSAPQRKLTGSSMHR